MKSRKQRLYRETGWMLESLEGRELLSSSHLQAASSGVSGRGGPGPSSGGTIVVSSHDGQTIQFSQAPTVVQTGLTTLASNMGLTAPIATQTVFLGNHKGIETYTIKETAIGTVAKLTVDLTGQPLMPPTVTTTTFGALNNAAVTDEVNAIAAALNLTAPASTTNVLVKTSTSGAMTFTVRLQGQHDRGHGAIVTVDSNGNPVGNQRLPFSVLPTAVQNGLTTNTPAGATALTNTSIVSVRTLFGVTTYSAVFNVAGQNMTVTVDEAGDIASLPSSSVVQFSTIPAAAQTALQSLATADGVTAPISVTQNVFAFDEANGTTIFTVKLNVAEAGHHGGSHEDDVRISVDQDGNPTVLPDEDGGHHDGADGDRGRSLS